MTVRQVSHAAQEHHWRMALVSRVPRADKGVAVVASKRKSLAGLG